jgi:hypothetical protein
MRLQKNRSNGLWMIFPSVRNPTVLVQTFLNFETAWRWVWANGSR